MAMSLAGAAAAVLEGIMGVNSKQQGEEMKVRKPYTITKQRESWTEQEHHKFLEALRLYDRDWKKIEAFVGTKTIIQIRSHAQKYFLKVQKNGTGEHVPPPRPKRKSSQPYPQKAPTFKASGGVSAGQGSGDAPERSNFSVDKSRSSGDFAYSKSGRPWNNTETGPSKMTSLLRGDGKCNAPDFAGVYSFLGGLFDPTVKKHNERLKAMEPIDRETVLLLMRNLVINLATPEVWAEQVSPAAMEPASAGKHGPSSPVLSPSCSLQTALTLARQQRNLLSQTRMLGLAKDAKADRLRQADGDAAGMATTSAAAPGQPSTASVQAMPPTPAPTPSLSFKNSTPFSPAGPPGMQSTNGLLRDEGPSTSTAQAQLCMAQQGTPRIVKMPALSTFGSNRWAQTAIALANSRVMEEPTLLGSEPDMPKVPATPSTPSQGIMEDLLAMSAPSELAPVQATAVQDKQLMLPQDALQTVDGSLLSADATADLEWWPAC